MLLGQRVSVRFRVTVQPFQGSSVSAQAPSARVLVTLICAGNRGLQAQR